MRTHQLCLGTLMVLVSTCALWAVDTTTESLPSGAEMVGYSASLGASNGTAPYHWSVLPEAIGWGGSNTYDLCVPPPELADITQIAAGKYHNLALAADGRVMGWGGNWLGQSTIPEPGVIALQVAAGEIHSLVLLTDGTLISWGGNDQGQCASPAGLSHVREIAAGNFHNLARQADGTVVAWGSNWNGESDVPAGVSNVTAIAAGRQHNAVLTADGRVVTWGWGGAAPAEATGIVQIAAGDYHTLALKENGQVMAWGGNWEGACDVPAELTHVIQIAAGANHSLALRADGTLVAWGGNASGQSTIPAELSGVTGIAAGSIHSLAFRPQETQLPEGIALTTDGALTGVPTGIFSNQITFVVNDATGATAQVSLTLQIDAVGTVGGQVRCLEMGVANGSVELYNASGTLCQRVATDIDGSYQFLGVPSGYYYIKAGGDGFADAWHAGTLHLSEAVPFAIAAGSTTSRMDFDLTTGRSQALVEITSTPAGARIYLDHQATTNVTPTTLDLTHWQANTTSETVHINISHPDYPRQPSRTLSPREAETVSIHYDLALGNTGALQITTTPAEAEIFVDLADAPAGMTPATIQNLAPGTHLVLIRKAGWLLPRPIYATVTAGATNTIALDLTPAGSPTQMATEITSVPPRAGIYLDYLPTTNLTDSVVDGLDPAHHAGPGWQSTDHTVMLTQPGFHTTAPQSIPEMEAEPATLSFHLTTAPGTGADENANGLPDAWELAYHMPELAATQSAPDDDPDSDGLTNADELAAGTNPTDSGSSFRMTCANTTPGPEQPFEITFHSVPGRAYLMLCAPTPRGPWVRASEVIQAQSQQTSWHTARPTTTDPLFFKAVVLAP